MSLHVRLWFNVIHLQTVIINRHELRFILILYMHSYFFVFYLNAFTFERNWL